MMIPPAMLLSILVSAATCSWFVAFIIHPWWTLPALITTACAGLVAAYIDDRLRHRWR